MRLSSSSSVLYAWPVLALSALRLSVSLQSSAWTEVTEKTEEDKNLSCVVFFRLDSVVRWHLKRQKGIKITFSSSDLLLLLLFLWRFLWRWLTKTEFNWRINDCQGYKKMLEKHFFHAVNFAVIYFVLGLTSIFDLRSKKHTWVTWEEKKGQIPEKQEQKTRKGGKKLVISL